jgi:hypothetical protein
MIILVSILLSGFSLFADNDSCIVEFNIEEINQYTFEFTAFSNVENPEYFWEFENGETGNGQSVVMEYNETRWYDVCVYMTDSIAICESSYCDSVFANVDSCNVFFDYQISDSNTVSLSAYGEGVAPYIYTWYVDDDEVGYGADFTLQLPESGDYLICVELLSDSGCVTEFCENIEIDTSINTGFSLSGNVYNDANPLENGVIKCYNYPDLQVVDEVMVDYGQYVFENLPIGSYSLKVIGDGNEYYDTWYGNQINYEDLVFIELNGNTWGVDINMQSLQSVNHGLIDSIEFWPIPVIEDLYYLFPQKESYSIQIYNQNFTLVYENELNREGKIELSTLSSGFYFIKLYLDEDVVYQAVITKFE